jgi:hypothetical protein
VRGEFEKGGGKDLEAGGGWAGDGGISEVDKCREGLTANSDESLHTLFIVLNTTFSKLEVSLRNAGKVCNAYVWYLLMFQCTFMSK